MLDCAPTGKLDKLAPCPSEALALNGNANNTAKTKIAPTVRRASLLSRNLLRAFQTWHSVYAASTDRGSVKQLSYRPPLTVGNSEAYRDNCRKQAIALKTLQ